MALRSQYTRKVKSTSRRVAHLSLPNSPPQGSSFRIAEIQDLSASLDKAWKRNPWARPSPGQSQEAIPRLRQVPALCGGRQKVTGHQAEGSPAIPAPGNSRPTALGSPGFCGPPWRGSGRRREGAPLSKAQQKIEH